MSNSELQPYLDFAVSVAEKANKIALEYFRSNTLNTEWKDNDTPLTVADTTINQLVIDEVKQAFPTHGVIGEEDSFDDTNEYVWVTDPIDGTIAFTMGMPIFTFCLALVRKGEVLVSVVSVPAQDRIFSASKGGGARMNGVPLHVSGKSDLKNAYVCTMDQMPAGEDKVGASILATKNSGAIILGHYSYAYSSLLVAEGFAVASVMGYGSPWDAAAPSLIVQEAGGKASDISGRPRLYNEWGEGTLLSNGTEVHETIVELISNAHPRN